MARHLDFVGRGRARVDEALVAPRSREPAGRDWLVAVVLAVAAVVELATSNESRWLNLAPALVSVAVFPYRRQRPALAAILAFASLLAIDLLTRAADIHAEITLGGSLARIALIYGVVRWSEAERRVRALLAVSALIVVWPLIDSTLLDAAIDLLAVLVVAAIAQAMRYRARWLSLITSWHFRRWLIRCGAACGRRPVIAGCFARGIRPISRCAFGRCCTAIAQLATCSLSYANQHPSAWT